MHLINEFKKKMLDEEVFSSASTGSADVRARGEEDQVLEVILR